MYERKITSDTLAAWYTDHAINADVSGTVGEELPNQLVRMINI